MSFYISSYFRPGDKAPRKRYKHQLSGDGRRLFHPTSTARKYPTTHDSRFRQHVCRKYHTQKPGNNSPGYQADRKECNNDLLQSRPVHLFRLHLPDWICRIANSCSRVSHNRPFRWPRSNLPDFEFPYPDEYAPKPPLSYLLWKRHAI